MIDFENNILYSNNESKKNINDWLFNGDNESKLNLVRKINLLLRNKGFNNVNFSINSKSVIQNGNNILIESIPVFTGVINKNLKNDYEKLILDINRDLQFENTLNEVIYN